MPNWLEDIITSLLPDYYKKYIEQQRSPGVIRTNPTPSPPSWSDVGREWMKSPTEGGSTLSALGKTLEALYPYLNPQSAITGVGGGAMAEIGPLYHGSGSKFTKFLNEFIGSGEGAQARGWGHYLTESPEVAEHYALQGVATKQPTLSEVTPIKRIYETTINKGKPSSSDVFLEWDKPLTYRDKVNFFAQLKAEKLPISKGFLKDLNNPNIAFDGATLYKELELTLHSDKEASEFLRRAGFTGIKYPTGTMSQGWTWTRDVDNSLVVIDPKGSVIKRFGTQNEAKDYLAKNQPYNYVVFNPEDITIEKVK